MTELPQIPHYARSCLETHLGLWCVDDLWAQAFLRAIEHGWLNLLLQNGRTIAPTSAESPEGYDLYGTTALVPLVGALSPKGSSFGGGSTIAFRDGLRAASRAANIETILAYINSPGGVVEGTDEAARALRDAGQRKPTHAHIQDMGASAAYWIASQAHRVTSNRAALVGNIGARMHLIDSSKAFELNGLKTYLFATGPYKAIGTPGVEITEDQRVHVQGLIDNVFGLFVDAVESGRGLSGERLDAVLTGATFTAEDALSAGLIDEVVDIETHLQGGNPMPDDTQVKTEDEALGIISRLFGGKRVTISADPEPQLSTAEFVPGTSVAEARSLGTYEEGLAAGVKAAREEIVAILEILTIHDAPSAGAKALNAIESGQSLSDLRRELAAESVLRASQDNEGKSTELDTSVTPGRKTVQLRSANEVAAERDRQARAR